MTSQSTQSLSFTGMVADGESKEEILTMAEVLESQIAEEQRPSTPKLHDGDDACTFPLGYINQQVYSCAKCINETGKVAGMCEFCAYSCHSHHANDIVSLWGRRYFKCDCGTKKMPEYSHSHGIVVLEENLENIYEPKHNFYGRFCTCDTIYDDETSDIMLVCVLCEDWFHLSCLPSSIRELHGDERGDMVCSACVKRASFLRNVAYHRLRIGFELESEFEGQGSSSSRSGDKCIFSKEGGEDHDADVLLFKAGWLDDLCQCEACVANYLTIPKMKSLLDSKDDIHGESDGDAEHVLASAPQIESQTQTQTQTSQPKTQLESEAEESFSHRIQTGEYDPTMVRELSGGFCDILDQFHILFEKKRERGGGDGEGEGDGVVVTKDDVQQIFAELESKRRRM